MLMPARLCTPTRASAHSSNRCSASCTSPSSFPTARARCSTWSTTSSAIRSSCRGAAAAQVLDERRRRQDRAHRHRLSRHPRAFHDRQRQRRAASRSSSRCRTVRSATCTANGGSARSPPTRARSSSTLAYEFATHCSRRVGRPGVRPHREHVHRRVRAPRGSVYGQSAMTRHGSRITVAYAAPGVEAMVALTCPRAPRWRTRWSRADCANALRWPRKRSATRSSASAPRRHTACRWRPGRADAAARRRPEADAKNTRRRQAPEGAQRASI